MRRDTPQVVVIALLLAATFATASAQSADILVDGGFEAGGAGWVAEAGTLIVDGAPPVHEGAAAGHLVATGPGPIRATTQYWLVPAAAAAV